MTKCSVCDRRMIGGYRDGDERFCSLLCYTHNPTGTFCQACLDSTSLELPGDTFTFHSIGTGLFFSRDRCPSCHSIVQTKAFCAFFIPLIPLGRYRILYTDPRRYIGWGLADPGANAARSNFPR